MTAGPLPLGVAALLRRWLGGALAVAAGLFMAFMT